MKKLFTSLFLYVFSCVGLFADYETGKSIFHNKCSECHAGYVIPRLITENFYEKKNKLLNLKAPSENMLAFAIIEGARKVGNPNDHPEMHKWEVEAYLVDYLFNPDLSKSICDPLVLRYYDVKDSLKGKVNEEEISHIADFFIHYKEKRQEKQFKQE